MTLYWTFLSNELTRKSSCSIVARRNFFELCIAWSWSTTTPYSNTYQNDWHLLSQPMMWQSVSSGVWETHW